MKFTMQQLVSQMCQISLIKNMTFYHIGYPYLSGLIKCFNLFFKKKNESNLNTPPSYTAWSGYDKHETEGSVRAIWTLICRRMSQDSSLSPAQGHCQQEAVPTLHHVVCLQAAAQHRASSAEAGWRRAVEKEKQGIKNDPSVRINSMSPP